ncbi:hypothetical protein M0802_011180 [Mischocyttarus mexicanus]|nr:hypothetical protein M0802_011180 [Mischocyttarus mexicanus]
MELVKLWIIVPTILLIGLFYIVLYLINRFNMMNKIKNIPGPKAYPIIGNAYMLLGNTNDMAYKFLRFGENYGSFCRIWLGPILIVMVNDFSYIKEILNNENVIEKSKEYETLKMFTGDSLLTAPAFKWKTHRKIVFKSFNKKIIEYQVNVTIAHSITLTEVLENLNGKEIEIHDYLLQCTLDVLYESMFDSPLNLQKTENWKLIEFINCLMCTSSQRVQKFWLRPEIIFNNCNIGKIYKKNLSKVDDLTWGIIKTKKESMLENQDNREFNGENYEDKPNKFIDILLQSLKKGNEYTEQDIRDEMNLMILAASDTSSTGISFALLMLATYPEIQNKVYEEQCKIFGSSDLKINPITYKDISQMNYLERVILETLRLFPPVPILFREATKDIPVNDKITIPKDSSISFNIFLSQRDEKYWTEPLNFNPDRFLKANTSELLSFSWGKRNCIGKQLAFLQMKIIIASLIRKFIITTHNPIEAKDIKLKMKSTLSTVIPTHIKFEKRY